MLKTQFQFAFQGKLLGLRIVLRLQIVEHVPNPVLLIMSFHKVLIRELKFSFLSTDIAKPAFGVVVVIFHVAITI